MAVSNLTSVLAEEFNSYISALKGIDGQKRFAVAVSGGGDSMALVLLMNEWAKEKSVEVVALTVDHDLRADSKKEAQQVHTWLEEHGIEHHILIWNKKSIPQSGLQEQAREARYALLAEFCLENKISHLMLGHNQEDQIETFWMRLSSGSGPDGLACMNKITNKGGLVLLRPLLDASRDALRQTCQRFNQDWIDDPSNQKEDFKRVRFRKTMGFLEEEGFTKNRVLKTIEKMSKTRRFLEKITKEIAQKVLTRYSLGYVVLDKHGWDKLDDFMQERLLREALKYVSFNKYAPRSQSLEELCNSIRSKKFAGKTLAGCEIFIKEGNIYACQEERVIESGFTIHPGKKEVWNRRILVHNTTDKDIDIKALGEDGAVLARKVLEIKNKKAEDVLSLPFKVLKTLPGIWRKGELISVADIWVNNEEQEVFPIDIID